MTKAMLFESCSTFQRISYQNSLLRLSHLYQGGVLFVEENFDSLYVSVDTE